MSLVVAGVASGICFLIYSGIFKGKSGGSKEDEKQVHVDENHCACCLRPFHLGRGVRCKDCGARSCRKGCSRWDASDKAWHCLFCRQQSYWLKQKEVEVRGGSLNKKDLHRYFSTAKARVYVAGVENATTSSGQSLAAEREEANTMETIRDFVERIVEGLIGNMDDTPINRLYDHPAYDKVSEKHIVSLVDALTRLATVLHLCIKNKPNANTPSMAHTTLREVVERVVDEARKLPGLGGSGGTGRVQEGCNIAEHSYEDLLATAILNKVIEKFQKERMDGNSNVLTGKPVSTTKCSLSENEAILDEGVEEGCSSLEPLSQDDCSSDCSASCLRRVRNQPEPLSLTIEERIEEVTTTYASDEEPKENDVLAIRNTHRVPFPELGMDVIDLWQESEDSQDELDITKIHIDMVSPVESWEENWLFQKKRVQTQADPVAMLVPNPSADFKALIGDKDAEDTSDLSECSSAQSDEEIEKELEEAINNVVPRSPKGSEFENGLDHYRQPSDDVLYEENSVNTTSRNVDTPGSKAGERTNWKLVRGQSETKMKDEKTAVDCVRSQSLKENGHDEYRGVEMNFERFEIGDERSVQKSIKAIREDLKKVEMERQMTNEMPKENKTEHSTGNEDPLKMDRSEFVAENSSSFTDLRSSTVCSTRENDPDVPKTPTSTPTCCSVPEISLGNPNDEETNVLRVENVLNSLERAKKKLMEDNDDTVEVFEDEEARTARQKVDFHAEDIQQESEYTEHYDIATQRHLDSLTKSETFESTLEKESSMEDEGSKCREAVASAKAESASHPSLRRKNSEEDVRFSTPPRPGTIAEREHRKWENAPPIENNPYSQENIQKRLWERQYSRRSSDIPGFSRDYYINDSKATGSEKGRRSAASTSSRPSSSLSQGSSSTGMADQDQQVSFQLEQFEEASLRGSLSRRTYRDPHSSPHFAINPLLRMDLDQSAESADCFYKSIELPNEKPFSSESNHRGEARSLENARENEEEANEYETVPDERDIDHFSVNGRNDESLRSDNDTLEEANDDSFALSDSSSKVAYNPLYKPQGNDMKPDNDSGMYSVETNDLEGNKGEDQDSWKRLWVNDWQNSAINEQILFSHGRKYWNFNGYKYHTFGGIKCNLIENVEDSDEDNLQMEAHTVPFDFSNFKYQTFGGIKRGKKIDGRGIPMYRKVTLRSSMRSYKNSKRVRSPQSDPVLPYKNGMNNESNGNFDSLSIERTNYQNDDYEENDKNATRKNSNSKRSKRKPKTIVSASYRSTSDDDWQDEDVHAPDNVIMQKFLKDASRKVKSRSNTDNESTYFLNTSRRKVFDDGAKKTRLQKHRSLDSNDSLKLEPPLMPEVVERTFESLRDLRSKGRKTKHKGSEPIKKLGVRSLSDLTIW
ncbi:uncharacterized protein LOC143430385 isoform X3 [Xylocopa sonorina]|uniref:uncharacterized protein LOC143430385 isoform X3 n=1 Tax=Xylocopa sonorina TaxID=1818115 RepID=UPI00403AFF52